MVFNSGELAKEKCSFLYPHANGTGHTAGRDSWIQSGPAGQEYGMVWQPTIPLPFTSLPCLVDRPNSDIVGGREGFWGKCWSSLGFGSCELRIHTWGCVESLPAGLEQVLKKFAEWRMGAKAVWAPSSDLTVWNKGWTKDSWSHHTPSQLISGSWKRFFQELPGPFLLMHIHSFTRSFKKHFRTHHSVYQGSGDEQS